MKRIASCLSGIEKYVFYAAVILSAILSLRISVNFAYAQMIIAVIGIICDVFAVRARNAKSLQDILEHWKIDKELKDNYPSDYPFAAVVFDMEDGDILWANEEFYKATNSRPADRNISEVMKGTEISWMADRSTDTGTEEINGRSYLIYRSIITYTHLNKERNSVVLYLIDITEYSNMKIKYESTRPVIAIISIDNYEELLKKCTEEEKSLLLVQIDRKIADWASGAGGILLRYDRDKYLFVFEKRYFDKFSDNGFSILKDIKEVKSGENVCATLSIGVSLEDRTLKYGIESAKIALDMALSRSGDQAVIKSGQQFKFFGGHMPGTEKITKVRSRVIANVLKSIIESSAYVLVMGHKMCDLDCVGAEAGIAAICRSLGRDCYIIVDKTASLANSMIDRLSELKQYEGVFITPEQAIRMNDDRRLTIVVDTNRPEITECPKLLEAGRVAIIDHHRRAASYIDDCVLSMHEPQASSASELTADLVQYIVKKDKSLLKEEAEAMLAGIYLDTKSFSLKAGVRTFEISAYLKRVGADMTTVKGFFKNDLYDIILKNNIIESTHVYFDCFAVAKIAAETQRNIAGKASDELLEISDVEASAVIYRCGDKTLISARSLGHINVQLITEALGGGGSPTNAGAQLDGSIDETEQALIKEISMYLDNEKKSV